MSENSLIKARAQFHSFIEAFEKRDYAQMNATAQFCKDFVETSFRENIYADTEYTDAILDIVLFLYKEMYWETECLSVLKSLIDSPQVSLSHKKRALENLLLPDSIILLSKDEIEYYQTMILS